MERLNWNQFFLNAAQTSALRSLDPVTKIGCSIANAQNQIVSTGYNRMPKNCESLPWGNDGEWLETKMPYVVHAELNAILNAPKTDLSDCRLYVTLFPCNECAKAIIQSGIKEIYYLDNKYEHFDFSKAAKRMFELSGVKFIKYDLVENLEIQV